MTEFHNMKPFEVNLYKYPILDSEEKLQWYMNKLLHREVDLYLVCAEALDLDNVYLRRRRCGQELSNVTFLGAGPTLIEPEIYGRVDGSVVPVLREIHARREAELEKARRELKREASLEEAVSLAQMHYEIAKKNESMSWLRKIFN